MEILITGRNIDVTDGIRNHIEERFARIAKYLERVIEVQVTLQVEKYRHIAEVRFQLGGTTVHSKAESEDMYTSINRAMAKVEKRVRRYKDKLKGYRHGSAEKGGEG